MSNCKKEFTHEQITELKKSAESLRLALSHSSDPLADEFLNSNLGGIINEILTTDKLSPFDDIPHFELITRDCLPSIANIYFNFYSWARFGEPAYRQ